MVDPCPATTLDPYPISDMNIEVKGSASQQKLNIPTDTIAKLYGDRSGETFCGGKTLSIDSVSPALPARTEFLSFDQLSWTFTASSTDPLHVGVYTVNYKVEMDESALGVPPETGSFQLTIIGCQVDASKMNSPTPPPSQSYIVYTPKKSFNWEDFTITTCSYGVVHTYFLKTIATGVSVPIPGPTMVTQKLVDKAFEIYTTDPLEVGSYEIIIRGTTEAGKMLPNPDFSKEQIIPLIVTNDCLGDKILVDPSYVIPDVDYIIDVDPVNFFTPQWQNSAYNCPVTYEIRRITKDVNNLDKRDVLTAHETAVISFDSANGKFNVHTDDFKYANETWTIQVYKQSTYSQDAQQDGVYQFQISFLDVCWQVGLNPAQMLNAPYEYYLSVQELMYGTLMTIQPYQGNSHTCGGFTYELEYLSGNASDAGLSYSPTYTFADDGTNLVF